MATENTAIVTVTSVERRKRLSVNGNPSFDIHTDQGIYQTQTDASLGYGLPNLTNSRFPETYIIGKQVKLVMTKANRVWDVQWPDGSRIEK